MPLSHINLPAGLCTPFRTHSAQSNSAPPWLPTALGVRPNASTLPGGVYNRGSGGITPSTARRKEGFMNTCGMKGRTAWARVWTYSISEARSWDWRGEVFGGLLPLPLEGASTISSVTTCCPLSSLTCQSCLSLGVGVGQRSLGREVCLHI